MLDHASPTPRHHLRTHRPLALAVVAGVACGSLLTSALTTAVSTSSAEDAPGSIDTVTTVAQVLDPEVILPSRVDSMLNLTLDALDRASAAVADRHRKAAVSALRATSAGVNRSQLATLHQLNAPPSEDEESTAGPDSVLAQLNVEQFAITTVAGLFHNRTAPALLQAMTTALNRSLARRAALLTAVIALDPEEAGAPYADSLADTVPFYTDEVANLTEALADDVLNPAARATLTSALAKSQAAEAQVTAAFGGGE